MVVAAALRLFELTQQALWFDEAWTHAFTTAPLARILSVSQPIDQGNPPLYYAVLHLWTSVAGDGDWAFRFPSVVFGVLTVPVSYLLGKEIGGRALGLAVAALTAVSPINIEHSQQARGYALLALSATLAMWGLAHLLAHRADADRWIGSSLRGPRDTRRVHRRTDLAWLGVVVGTAVALLTHHTAVLLFGALSLVVAIVWMLEGRPRARFFANWLVAMAGVVVLWGPWIPNFLRQSTAVYRDFWIPFPGPYDVAVAAKHLVSGWTPLAIGAVSVCVAAVLAFAAFHSWRRQPVWIVFVVCLSLAVPLGELVVSLWRPVFRPQTWIWAAVPVSIAVARGALVLPRRWVAPALGTMIILSLSGYVNHQLRYQEPAWDVVATRIASDGVPNDVVVAPEPLIEPVVARYLGSTYFGATDPPVVEVFEPGDLPSAVAGRDTVWMLCLSPCTGNPLEVVEGLGAEWSLAERFSVPRAEGWLFVRA